MKRTENTIADNRYSKIRHKMHNKEEDKEKCQVHPEEEEEEKALIEGYSIETF